MAHAQILALWLHGRSPHTARAYRADVAAFGAFVGKPLRSTTLGDVQAYSDVLSELAPATRGRRLAAVWLGCPRCMRGITGGG